MMLTWSPHSGDRPDGSPKAAVDYMLNAAVQKKINGQFLDLPRDPPPELLLGDREIFPLVLSALPFKHRYNFATLSFHEQDISVASFNGGDSVSRQEIGKTLKLFFEIAWAGIPDASRPQPVVGTHTHTGRLEVNIMMARSVRNANGYWRYYNAHFPRACSTHIWDFFTDYVNQRFQWADPRAPERRRLVRLSSEILKKKAEAERLQKPLDISGPEQALALAENILARGGLEDRKKLLSVMEPYLDAMGIGVLKPRKYDVVFLEKSRNRKFSLAGMCLSEEFSSGAKLIRPYLKDPGIELDLDAAIQFRRGQLISSLRELTTSWEERAEFNSRRYGLRKTPTPSFWRILRQPGLELPAYHPASTGEDLDGNAHPAGNKACPANRTVSSRAEYPDSGSRRSGGAARGRTRHADDHAEFVRRAENPFEIFANIARRLARIMSDLRRRQAGRTLAKAMREQFAFRWHDIGDRLEILNDGTLTPSRMAGASGRIAQIDGIDRSATGLAGAGGGAGPFGQDRPLFGRDHPGGRSGGTGGNRNGGRAPEPRSGYHSREGSGRTETADRHAAERDSPDSGAIGRATGQRRLTRADLIRRARRIAQDNGIEAPQLSFVRDDDQELLCMEFGNRAIMFDGDGNASQDIGASEPDQP